MFKRLKSREKILILGLGGVGDYLATITFCIASDSEADTWMK